MTVKILINGVGGPTPRNLAKSLRKYSELENLELIGTDINPYAIGLYQKDLFDKTYLVPRAGAVDYWEVMERIIAENNIEFAMVQPELEVLEWSKRLKEKGDLPCKALISNFDLTQVLINKARTTEVLESTENLVPKSYSFHRDHLDLGELTSVLSYPFWIRSSSGTSGLGSLKIEDELSLKNWLTINPYVQEFIASEYLPGRNYACKLLYWEGELLQAACGERVYYVMSKVAPSGITGNTSFGRLLNRPDLFDISTKAMDLLFEATDTPKHGFFTVDLKEAVDGRPLITEINVRMVAFNNCFAAGGINFSESILKLLSGEKLRNDKVLHQFEEGLIFLRDVDEDPLMMNEADLLS